MKRKQVIKQIIALTDENIVFWKNSTNFSTLRRKQLKTKFM